MSARKTTTTKSKPAPKKPASETTETAPAARMARVPAPTPKTTPPRTPLSGVTADDEPARTPVSGSDTDTVGAPDLKKQELFKKVADRTGAKKNQVKPIVEAAMAIMGESLEQGRDMNLPPLGKVKQNRVKDNPNARVIIAKIRQPKHRDKGPVD